MTVADEEYIDIKSKPIYVPLEFDPKSRWSLLVAESEGLRGLIDLCSNSPSMKAADSRVMFAGTEAEQAERTDFIAYVKDKKAMDLMIPSEILIGEVPILGSGKIDFVTAREMILAPELATNVTV